LPLGNLELFSYRFSDREDGARAIDLDDGLRVRGVRSCHHGKTAQHHRRTQFVPQLHGFEPL